MMSCDLCQHHFSTWKEMGEHVVQDHLPSSNSSMARCFCGQYFSMDNHSHQPNHSDFSWHLFSVGGVGTHAMEVEMGVFPHSDVSSIRGVTGSISGTTAPVQGFSGLMTPNVLHPRGVRKLP